MRTVVAAMLMTLAGCSSHATPAGTPSASPAGARHVAVEITQGGAGVRIEAEVAATESARETGLMNRAIVPAGTGMLFVFPAPVQEGFWMKDTLVPLKILFIRDGVVKEVRTMQPCRADPCPVTRPSHDYLWALELGLDQPGPLVAGASVRVVSGSLPQATS